MVVPLSDTCFNYISQPFFHFCVDCSQSDCFTCLFLLTTPVLSVKQRGNVIHYEEERAGKPLYFMTNSIRLFMHQYTIHNAEQNNCNKLLIVVERQIGSFSATSI